MRWSSIVAVLVLLALSLVVTCSSKVAPTSVNSEFTHLRQYQKRPVIRVKRQISEIFRLYNELSKENREDREQATARIRAIFGRFFKPANATSTTAQISASTTEMDGKNSTTETPGADSTPKPMTTLDPVMLTANLKRNLKGLGRLFMKELRAALQGLPVDKV